METSWPQNHYLRTSRFCRPLEFWPCHWSLWIIPKTWTHSYPQENLRASYTKKAKTSYWCFLSPQAKNQTGLPGSDWLEWTSALLSLTVLRGNNSPSAFSPRNQIIGCLLNGAWPFNLLPLSWQTVLSPAHKWGIFYMQLPCHFPQRWRIMRNLEPSENLEARMNLSPEEALIPFLQWLWNLESAKIPVRHVGRLFWKQPPFLSSNKVRKKSLHLGWRR